jgi:hypothetical protein
MTAEIKNKLADVYGNSRDVPLTYQTRPKVDQRFINDITRDKHIVLHGGSKQGKTCLRKNHLNDADYVLVQCTRDTSRSKLYELILKNANYQYEVSSSITTSGTNKITVNISAESGLPFVAKAKGETEYEGSKEKEESTSYKKLDIDPEDPNDLVRVLTESGFNKIIVIEDFHYLDEEVQTQFAFDLKVIHETSKFVFVIIGVWLETNRLLLYNGDLNGRLTNINVDKWPDEYLQRVIDNGKPLLNISFGEGVENEIIQISQDNVGLLQELCYRLCEEHEVWVTQDEMKTIGNIQQVKEIAKEIADDQAGRYSVFLSKFSEGLSVTELEMYKWIMWVVINATSEELRNGISQTSIFHRIKSKHPKATTLQQNNVNQALERVQNVQYKHKLQPLILDYSNGSLSVVDVNFIVYLQTHLKDELLEKIGINIGAQQNL